MPLAYIMVHDVGCGGSWIRPTRAAAPCSSVLLADPEVRRAYDETALEYEIAREIIRARAAAGLTQEQLAERMGSAQSFVAKLESGRTLPSAATLARSPRRPAPGRTSIWSPSRPRARGAGMAPLWR